jgi:hypothetical protein
LHDETSTDRNNLSVNAYGIIYGATASPISFPGLTGGQQVRSSKTEFRDPKTPSTKDDPIYADCRIGAKNRSGTATQTFTTMYDPGRLWLTARICPQNNPAFCKQAPVIRPRRDFLLARSGRQAEMFDPKTRKITTIDLASARTICSSRGWLLWFSSAAAPTSRRLVRCEEVRPDP